MMEKEKDQGAINLSTAGKDTEPDGPITNGDISKATVEPDNTSQVCIDRYRYINYFGLFTRKLCLCLW